MSTADVVSIERIADGEALCLRLTGVIDERFEASAVFRDLPSQVILDLSGIRRITSFGVRQWSDAMKALPSRVQHLYVVRAPACFVDQLNMVLNFGGRAEVISATALYFCDHCQEERQLSIDVLGEHALLVTGAAPPAPCPTCGNAMALEDDPQQAFRYVGNYGARSVAPQAAPLLAAQGLYLPRRVGPPPEEWKLIHGEVTLLVLSGTLDQRFRPRRLSSGVEGDVVLDVGRVGSVDATGAERFRQLLAALEDAGSVTLVDVPEALLRLVANGGMPLGRARLYSALLGFSCASCGNEQRTTVTRVQGASFRPPCKRCGEPTLLAGAGPWLDRAFRGEGAPSVTAAVEQLIAQREELISRARAESGVRAEPQGTLGRYRVLRPLSRGGMAEILLAVHEGIGGFEKLIALKKIRRTLLERKQVAVELFLNEAKIVANLNHPNIVQTFEVGEHGGDLFIAMEYVHGVDARTVVKKRVAQRGKGEKDDPLGMPFVLYLGTQVAAALDHAHKARDLGGRPLRIVHRDVSLSNIVIGFDGQVKLVDFGIATAASIEGPSTGDSLVGKFSYMSPEQVRKESLDGRSDVFSLGIALYELISGRPLFRRGTDEDTLHAVQEEPVPSLAEHGVSPAIEAVLRRALERDRERRYADAHAFELALQTELQSLGGVSAHQLSMRMRELFPTESSAAPTAGLDGVPLAEVTANDSGPSISHRSQTFQPSDFLPPDEPSVITSLLPAPEDVLITPPHGVEALTEPPKPPSPSTTEVTAPEHPAVDAPLEVKDRRGSDVHFNRVVRVSDAARNEPRPDVVPAAESAPAREAKRSTSPMLLIAVLVAIALALLVLVMR